MATAETECSWLQLACGRTIRALAAMIRAAGPSNVHEVSEIVFTAPASVVALFRTAILAVTDRTEWYWTGFERLLRHVQAEWTAQPRHRDPVFERDGWQCAVPACSSRGNLHDHHVLFRSRGGDNARDNRVTVCAAHHLHGIHAGRIRAWGTAPEEITWELGVRPGRAPLRRCAGDRYVVAR